MFRFWPKTMDYNSKAFWSNSLHTHNSSLEGAFDQFLCAMDVLSTHYSRAEEFPAHVHHELHAVALHSCVVGLDGGDGIQDVLGHLQSGQLGQVTQALVALGDRYSMSVHFV